MTILFIDAGNSRAKFGWRASVAPQGGAVRAAGQAAFGYDALASELPAWLATLGTPPVAALGTNVAGTEAGARIAGLLAAAGCRVAWVSASAARLGLVNGYRQPGSLGADRWMALAGIWSQAGRRGSHVLAHFGTATTIDTLDGSGRFLGGLIVPGPALMRAALARGTAQLPDAQGAVTAFPTDTHDAIATGIAAAQAGAVARQWRAAQAHLGEAPVLHVSGGAWPAVEREVIAAMQAAGDAQAPHVVDNPVLDGLACLAAAEPQLLD